MSLTNRERPKRRVCPGDAKSKGKAGAALGSRFLDK